MPAIGKDTMSSLVRHFILPQVTDNAYTTNNALLYRMIRGNKRTIQGGRQIEAPLLYKKFSVGGTYRGFEVLDTAPQDNVKNAFWDWKQHYVSFAIDGLSLIQSDTSLAIANLINLNGQQMYMEMAENLALGVTTGDGVVDPKDIDGLPAIVSDTNTYAGIDRTVDTWWKATIDSATTTLDLDLMRSLMGDATVGASHPTIWFGNSTNYNRLYALNLSTTGYGVRYIREPGGSDEVLAQAGFTNLIFENIPFVRDDNFPDARIYALNENFIQLVVSPRADFYLSDVKEPPNQDSFIWTLFWAGNVIVMNSKSQAAFTGLTA